MQQKAGKDLKAVLLEGGFISEDDLLGVLSYELSIPFLDISKLQIDPLVADEFSEDVVRSNMIFPLYKIDDLLVIAVAEPLDIITIENFRLLTRCQVRQVLGREKVIASFIETYYTKAQTLPEILDSENVLESGKKEFSEAESADLIQESQKEPIVKTVNFVIHEAIVKKASDIHLEPTEEDLTVRYRIDGMLVKAYSLPKKVQKGVFARLKILSNLDITKNYLPQDGRFNISFQGKAIDFRVSSLPAIYGEKFVLRILDKTGIVVDLDSLDYSQEPLNLIKEAIAKDHGMILVTGPTGSGKSTTLYAVLSRLNTSERHIMTIEDPIEYQLDGVSQTAIRSDIDFTFAKALRGMLRQSPDVIMVGEIRDGETADIAIKASLIGQLILSTLHTNDAISSFARLMDMGIEKYLVVSSLILVCAQRLCRRICKHCKEPIKSLPKHISEDVNFKIEGEKKFFIGRGCSYCYKTGYKGRVALLEALRVDDVLRNLVISGHPLDEIKETLIREKKLITLRQDGFKKALEGLISIDEVYRVSSQD